MSDEWKKIVLKKYFKGCVAKFSQQRSLLFREPAQAHGCPRMRSRLIWPHFQALMMRWKVVCFHRFSVCFYILVFKFGTNSFLNRSWREKPSWRPVYMKLDHIHSKKSRILRDKMVNLKSGSFR